MNFRMTQKTNMIHLKKNIRETKYLILQKNLNQRNEFISQHKA